MQALLWIGGILFLLGFLAWAVFKITIKIAIFLFLAGIVLIIWGAVKAKQNL